MTRIRRLDFCCPGLAHGNRSKKAEDDPIPAGLDCKQVAVNLKKPRRRSIKRTPTLLGLGAVREVRQVVNHYSAYCVDLKKTLTKVLIMLKIS